MRVLIAEDNHILARTLATGFRRAAIAVDIAHSGDVAERLCLLNDYDVVILDRDLPVLSGDEVCRRLRELRNPPRILMLTAAGTLEDKVYGLDHLGADDYLPKPFDFAELVTRVRVLSRRVPFVATTGLRHGSIEIDRARHEVRVEGRLVELTPKEYAVLRLLMEAQGAPVTHRELLDRAWDENLSTRTNAVRATVSRLRTKLGGPGVISADDGTGYRLC
ncbi:response regulator transcription factor [Peterkaempfera griseoplana]|uniref:response regulator transcription factor n=1 Tax=Peterkaempfera griseoplana TaxID=66896 RepID=UPI0006E230E1|nr:response regulator transcription factor [Peterkaempfera griseoplana]